MYVCRVLHHLCALIVKCTEMRHRASPSSDLVPSSSSEARRAMPSCRHSLPLAWTIRARASATTVSKQLACGLMPYTGFLLLCALRGPLFLSA
ncbi:hypothetical protein L227DRAFT_243226 [Lentinus tigrinus ALCF2SS1-6]|uniref:Uncharacterized protein n=1 Tax=Lentinus tigrinus ALCF2SS1-6 TaxID=1328759 RepID=A0A5C2S0Q3_9APHY|nr:hypothetical protein L227DRAFT_243226 [Lentinus tigrinus ALCF2SS1-6]